jgi:ATP-dependent protease Clp ATPase subunit
VVATLEDLDEASLKKIQTDPKNALAKQYQRLFEMENIELTFADEALGAVARKTIEPETGAHACARSSRAFCSGRCTAFQVWKVWKKS